MVEILPAAIADSIATLVSHSESSSEHSELSSVHNETNSVHNEASSEHSSDCLAVIKVIKEMAESPLHSLNPEDYLENV